MRVSNENLQALADRTEKELRNGVDSAPWCAMEEAIQEALARGAEVASLHTALTQAVEALVAARQWIEPVVEGFGLDPKTHVVLERVVEAIKAAAARAVGGGEKP